MTSQSGLFGESFQKIVLDYTIYRELLPLLRESLDGLIEQKAGTDRDLVNITVTAMEMEAIFVVEP